MTTLSRAFVCLGTVVLLTAVYALFPYRIGGFSVLRNIGTHGVIDPEISDETIEQLGPYGDKPIDDSIDERTCQLPVTSNFSDLIKPLVRHETLSYVIPTLPSNRTMLDDGILANSTVFAFVHINKAGGTLIKEDIFKPAAKQNNWDGVGWGSTVGWEQLLKPCGTSANKPSVSEEALACGSPVSLSPCGPVGGGICPIRMVWGTHTMGMCQLFPNRSCVMTVVLRHPVVRAISQYNYVCVEGREGQKKWLPEWRASGRCPLTLLQFLDTHLTSRTFLIDHLARTSDPGCGGSLALKNLLHPCVRFLLLDKLADGLARLAKVWGPAMRPHLDRMAVRARNDKRNQSPYEARVRVQMENETIIAKVREMLSEDIRFYQKAVKFYEKQWDRPLVSCNPFGPDK